MEDNKFDVESVYIQDGIIKEEIDFLPETDFKEEEGILQENVHDVEGSTDETSEEEYRIADKIEVENAGCKRGSMDLPMINERIESTANVFHCKFSFSTQNQLVSDCINNPTHCNMDKCNCMKNSLVVQHKCVICGCFFKQIGDLTHHIQMLHEKEKPFKCIECGFFFSEKSQLTRHIRIVHVQEKPYQCAECGCAFSLKCNLTRHHSLFIYEKERPFMCNECRYSFSQKSDLIRHIQVIHIKEKPFVCNECGFSCSRKNSLERHIRRIHKSVV